MRFEERTSLLNGVKYKFAKYYQIHDKRLEEALCNISEIYSAEELTFFKNVGWNARALAKNFTTPLMCMGILSVIGERKLYEKFSDHIYAMSIHKK